MARKIQLSLQGGGAKLVFLVAALKRIRELEDQGHIEVVRVAGTSAGALAACLFASKCSWNEVEILVRRLSEAAEQNFRLPGKWRIFWKLWYSKKPVWDENPIRKILSDFFSNNQIGELKIETKVVCSSLESRKEFVSPPTQDIVSAIMDSCGIPFLFRHIDDRVDGGLCSNLPVLQLGEDDFFYDIPTVALSFAPGSSEKPQSVGSFLKGLVDTAIDNSVQRSKKTADFIFEIGPNSEENLDVLRVGTLDFEKAKQVFDSAAQVKQVGDVLERQMRSSLFMDYANVVAKKREVSTLNSKLGAARTQIYNLMKKHLEQTRNIKKVVIQIEAHSLEDPEKLDEFWVKQTFTAAPGKVIQAVEFQVEKPYEMTSWELRTEEGQSIPCEFFEASTVGHEIDGDNWITVVGVPEKALDDSQLYLLSTRERAQCFNTGMERSSDGTSKKPNIFSYKPKASTYGQVDEVLLLLHYSKKRGLRIGPCEDKSLGFRFDELDTQDLHPDYTRSSYHNTVGVRSFNVGENGVAMQVFLD